jgi:hypothetical protein
MVATQDVHGGPVDQDLDEGDDAECAQRDRAGRAGGGQRDRDRVDERVAMTALPRIRHM